MKKQWHMFQTKEQDKSLHTNHNETELSNSHNIHNNNHKDAH